LYQISTLPYFHYQEAEKEKEKELNTQADSIRAKVFN